MAKVTYLNPTVAATVGALKDLLERAKKGEIEFVLVNVMEKEGHVATIRGGVLSGYDALTFAGFLEREKMSIILGVQHETKDNKDDELGG